MKIELVRRLSVAIIVFFLTLAATVAAVHAAENPRKMTVVSFGLFGDQGVFRREATGAAQIVANWFGGDPVVENRIPRRAGTRRSNACNNIASGGKKDEWRERHSVSDLPCMAPAMALLSWQVG